MRVFIAVNFTQDVKQKLCEIIQKLQKESENGNFTRMENLHLTLAFIGEVSPKQVPEIEHAMEKAVSECNSFVLQLCGFGYFMIRGEKLYWCGVPVNQELIQLQEKLVKQLKSHHIPFDDKTFEPHITLGRRCHMKQSFDENQFEQQIPLMKMNVSDIHLMKSERVNGKLVYTSLYEAELKGARSI